jgi:hypothetical protein
MVCLNVIGTEGLAGFAVFAGRSPSQAGNRSLRNAKPFPFARVDQPSPLKSTAVNFALWTICPELTTISFLAGKLRPRCLMAYVPEYDHDVFVSYAHLDNEGELPWVSTLVHDLNIRIPERLGTKGVHIWRDDRLEGNRPFTPEVLWAIQRAATLLIVMSPGYVKSQWCSRERNAFFDIARDCIATGRIFIVEYLDTNRSEVPAEFRELKGYKFWTQDGRTTRPLGISGVKGDEYWNRLLTLRDSIARTLEQLRSTKISGPILGPATESIFLAQVTDDLESREEELVGYLSQMGLSIQPQTRYPEDSEQAFASAMRSDLLHCSAFVQLLSKLPGRRTRFANGQRLPVFQHDIARAVGRPVLQWREHDDDPAAVTDETHRELLDGARACGFEEFKRSVVETARRQPQGPKTRRSNVAVFVNADRDDLNMARELSELLAQEGVESYWPISEGSPEKVRRDLEENLKACDGLVLIYGSTEPSWVRDQLRQGRKILSQRERDLSALAIFLGPPTQKHELAIALPQLVMLDGRAGITAESLRPFIRKLASEA